MDLKISKSKRNIPVEQVLELYEANNWSAAKKPSKLYNGLLNSHQLFTAWDNDKLIGLGNAISDGYLLVYFPHLLVLPEYKNKGVGKAIMHEMKQQYETFHMQMLTADVDAIPFYEKIGFSKAGTTQAMWMYKGVEHS